MAMYTTLDQAAGEALGEELGLDVVRTEGLLAGSVNSNYALHLADGSRMFLRIYEEQSKEGAADEIDLLLHLAKHGIAAPNPVSKRDGSYLAEHENKAVAVFPWLAGEMRCQRSVTAKDAFEVGAALAKIHVIGAPKIRESRFSPEKLVARCDVIEASTDPALSSMANVLRYEISAAISARIDAPRGLCHGDLFRDNVLWNGDSLSALLDFESAADGPFAFDLAVTMLAWSFGDDFVPAIARALSDGYRSVRELEIGDREALYTEARLASLRFTTTRITDYAMRAHLGKNVPRDWMRFWKRYQRLGELNHSGLAQMLGLV